MIDWHTHILPYMDDGSKNEEMSASMMKKSCEEGVNTVILTPHFYPHKEDPKRFISRRSQSLEKLLSHLQALDAGGEKIKWPGFILGAEVFYFHELARIDEEILKYLCIGNSKYLMVELPVEPWSAEVYASLESLIFNRGIIPVLAHIDRYFHIIKDISPLTELVEEGMLIQLNAGALDGFFSRRKALKMIDSGLVHILASDCHNMSDRPPNLKAGFDKLKDKIDSKTAYRLVTVDPN